MIRYVWIIKRKTIKLAFSVGSYTAVLKNLNKNNEDFMSCKEALLSVPDQWPTLYKQNIGKGNNGTVKIDKNVFLVVKNLSRYYVKLKNCFGKIWHKRIECKA